MMKFRKQRFLYIPLCAILVGATGCSTFVQKKVSADELSKSYARTATAQPTVTDEFKTSFTDFSLTTFRETVKGSKENKLFSPLSAALCLALVNNGANGETRAQLETLFNMDTDTLNRALYKYTNGLYSGEDCTLNLANSIWMKDNALNVKPEFLQNFSYTFAMIRVKRVCT